LARSALCERRSFRVWEIRIPIERPRPFSSTAPSSGTRSGGAQLESLSVTRPGVPGRVPCWRHWRPASRASRHPSAKTLRFAKFRRRTYRASLLPQAATAVAIRTATMTNMNQFDNESCRSRIRRNQIFAVDDAYALDELRPNRKVHDPVHWIV